MPAAIAGASGGSPVAAAGFVLELQHHLAMDDDWLVAETARLAEELGLPVVVTNDVHYALPEDRELHDVLTAIRHGRPLETLADLRSPTGEAYLKSAEELAGLPPGDPGRDGRSPDRPGLDGGTPHGGGARGGLLGRARLRALSLPGVRGAERGDAVQPPLASCAGPARGGATTR